MEPSVRAFRLTAASILALAATLVVVAVLPVSWRTVAFLVGLAAVGALGIGGGTIGRRALQAGAPHPGRTIAVSIVGLTLGATATISAALGLLSLVG
jgi:hypothetical protein